MHDPLMMDYSFSSFSSSISSSLLIYLSSFLSFYPSFLPFIATADIKCRMEGYSCESRATCTCGTADDGVVSWIEKVNSPLPP